MRFLSCDNRISRLFHLLTELNNLEVKVLNHYLNSEQGSKQRQQGACSNERQF